MTAIKMPQSCLVPLDLSEYRRKILEYRWEITRKKIVQECMWQVSEEGKNRLTNARFGRTRAVSYHSQCTIASRQALT